MKQRFRGIVVVATLTALLTAVASGDDDVLFARLFDGSTLVGWTGEHTDRYSVRHGVIVHDGGAGWLRYNKTFKDFELRAEYRALKKETVGGLLFRASLQSTPKSPYLPAQGYQLRLNDTKNNYAILGIGVAPPKFNREASVLKEAMKGPAQWQTITLRVVGTRAEAALNGKKITVCETIDIGEGSIGLRSEDRHVEWRNLKIKELPAH